ncbi:MAG: hypothetical protein ACK4WF_04145 [Candidatus Brocadiales bacterium]
MDNLTDTGRLTRELRECLKCGRWFKSAGPHNRLCKVCNVVNKKYYRHDVPRSTQGGVFELTA